ncbi:MAG: prolyl oligopeptidase family serine peptidase, partial [Gemmataceae bacterium]
MKKSICAVLVCAGIVSLVAADGPGDNRFTDVRPIPPIGAKVPEADLPLLQSELAKLQSAIADLRKQPAAAELLPDVEIFAKAVQYGLEHNEMYIEKSRNDVTAAKKLLVEGLRRAEQLKSGDAKWTRETGMVVRGYRSKIDDSVQPYGLVIPKSYDFQNPKPARLDFWWHGRGELLNEIDFLRQRMVTPGEFTPENTIVLHPYGRYCNANKFAGEIDTLECLEDVQKHYKIDTNRIVARGFSMGGAACWQFATHYPRLWCAAAPGAGFSETPEFLNVFQNEKVEPTWYEQRLWHLYNATDYTLNLSHLPTVAYSGEIDKQKQAADAMAKAMKPLGLELTHLIGPKTGHSYEKTTKAEINKRIDAFAAIGRDPAPAKTRFITYTLRYNASAPFELLGLGRHWQQATLDSDFDLTTDTFNIRTKNITAFRLTTEKSREKGTDTIHAIIDGQNRISWKSDVRPMNFQLRNDRWEAVAEEPSGLRKRPGLQGPIDDAFMDRFIMVRPTGAAKNADLQKWTEREMQHAITHWRKQFRGDCIVKDDTAITAGDIASANLVVWGDPSSNSVLKSIAEKLVLPWPAEPNQALILIQPNPLNPKKYLVLNSGFTFREYDYL